MNRQQTQTFGLILLIAVFLFQITYFSPRQKQESEPATTTNAESSHSHTLLDTNYTHSEQLICIENEALSLGFSQKGGTLAHATLKSYKDGHHHPLPLLESDHTQLHTTFVMNDGQVVDTQHLHFTHAVEKREAGTQVTFTAYIDDHEAWWIKHIFYLPQKGYQVEYREVKSPALQKISSPTTLAWTQQLQNQEKHFDQSLPKTCIKYYYTQDGFLGTKGTWQELRENKKEPHQVTITTPVEWIAMHTPYFLVALTGDTPLLKSDMRIQLAPEKATHALKEVAISTAMPSQITFYLGPNDYTHLKGFARGFEQNHYLGPWLFRWCNTYCILPTYEYLKGYTYNGIWTLLLLILLLSLLLFFFNRKAYINNVKMKGAKPIIDKMNPEGSKDPQHTLETMRIYTQIGAGPFKGMLYGLIQLPIFIAMLSFTQHKIEFRQLSFLWISDISAYDATISLPFYIPFLGQHISLIGLFSSALFSVINELKRPPTIQQDSSGKIVSYSMPILILFMFNSSPSSWWIYRFFSNMMELIQHGILKLTTNEEAIREAIYEKTTVAYEQLQTSKGTNRTMKRMQKKK